MYCISLTAAVLNPLTSSAVSLEHPLNIYFMFVTDCVFNLLASRLVSDEHKLNMYCISATCEVSNLLMSTEVNPLQFPNMPAMLVDKLLSKRCMSIVFAAVNPANIYELLLFRYTGCEVEYR